MQKRIKILHDFNNNDTPINTQIDELLRMSSKGKISHSTFVGSLQKNFKAVLSFVKERHRKLQELALQLQKNLEFLQTPNSLNINEVPHPDAFSNRLLKTPEDLSNLKLLKTALNDYEIFLNNIIDNQKKLDELMTSLKQGGNDLTSAFLDVIIKQNETVVPYKAIIVLSQNIRTEYETKLPEDLRKDGESYEKLLKLTDISEANLADAKETAKKLTKLLQNLLKH